MDRIKFMIDSGSDIPREVAQALNIEVVPLYRVIDGELITDYYDFNINEYCDYLRSCKEIPSSSGGMCSLPGKDTTTSSASPWR